MHSGEHGGQVRRKWMVEMVGMCGNVRDEMW